MSKPARDYEKMRPVIMRAISLGSTPERICAKHMLHWPTLMRHLRKWLNEGRPAPAPIVLPIADAATAFLDQAPIKPAPIAIALSKRRQPHEQTERNELIVKLIKAGGMSYAMIAKHVGCSRSAVSGVADRAGVDMSPEEKALSIRRENKRRATSRGNPPRADGHAWNFSANAHRNAAIFGKGQKGESTGPINLEKHYEPIPPHAVTIEHLTGCRWPFGDVRGEGIAYCNRPRCRVQVHHLATPILTAYCHAHWEQRRTSKATRIIHDNMQRLNGSATY
jgi:hypothetical protein